MTWLSRLAERFSAWYIRRVDSLFDATPNFTTSPAMRRYRRLAAAVEGGDYKPLVAAASLDGARTTTRKRAGNIVVIIDLPNKGGPNTRLRLKFKAKP